MSEEVDQTGEYIEPADNDHLVLVVGESSAGKSASLRNIQNQEGWVYMNFESGKKLPFKNQFNSYVLTDPMEALPIFQYAIDNPGAIEGIIVDSLTFMLDRYVSLYVDSATDGRKAWGKFQQFFKTLMQEYVAQVKCPVIFLAHTRTERDEKTMRVTTSVPVQGSLKNTGIEAYFSLVIAAKRIPLKDLEEYSKDNTLLEITERDKRQGYKHVFQTQITKETTGERIRGPMDMWSFDETFIDNDSAKVLQRLVEFYS